MSVIDELKAVVASVLPNEIARPWLEGAPGSELLESVVRVYARIYNDWITNGIQKAYYLKAGRGTRSQAVLTFTIDTADDVLLGTGSIFKAEDGRRYRSTGNVLVEEPSSTVDVAVEAMLTGPQHDSDDGVIYEPVIPIWLDPISEEATTGPDNEDFTFVEATEASGGQIAMLDMLADDRGVQPDVNESEESLRSRSWGRFLAVVMADLRTAAEETFWDGLWSGIDLEAAYDDLVLTGPKEQACEVGGDYAVGEAFASSPPPALRMFMPDLPDDEGTDDDGETYLLRTLVYKATAAAISQRTAGGVTLYPYRGTPPLEE